MSCLDAKATTQLPVYMIASERMSGYGTLDTNVHRDYRHTVSIRGSQRTHHPPWYVVGTTGNSAAYPDPPNGYQPTVEPCRAPYTPNFILGAGKNRNSYHPHAQNPRKIILLTGRLYGRLYGETQELLIEYFLISSLLRIVLLVGISFKKSEASFIVPNSEDLEKLVSHMELLEDACEEDWNFVSIIQLFDHPIWWVSPGFCEASHVEDCFCGKIDLLSIIGEIENVDVRKRAFSTHADAMAEAYNHYWSGDGLFSGKVFDVCVSCLTIGEDHVALVGYQAEQLAIEYGAALAAYPTL